MSERSRDLPRRSCLSIPGSSEKMLGKGPGIPADMVFLDLEDAVAPKEKEARPGQGGRRHPRPGVGRQGLLRPCQRLVDQVDGLRHHGRGRRGGPAAGRDHGAEGGERGPGGGHGPPAGAGGAGGRPARRPHRDRGPDRDDPRSHQRRGDLRRVATAGDDHLRPGRLRGLDGDAGADRRRPDRRLPGRPLPLRLLEDPHGRAGQRAAGHRRAVPLHPGQRRLPRLLQAHPHARATTASGRSTRTR